MKAEDMGNAVLKIASNLATRLTDNYLLERRFKAALAKPSAFHPRDRAVIYHGKSIPLKLFFPPTAGPHGVLIFFHGGGWVSGDTNSYARTLDSLAKVTDRTVVAVDYRLAPEHPFPEGLTDCYIVARELHMNPERLGIYSNDIVTMGDSAGGNLCAAVSLIARDRGGFIPRAQILIYPALYNDYSENTPFESVRRNGEHYILTAKRLQEYMNYYAPEERRRHNRYIAPLLCRDHSGLPPTLIFTAEFDPLCDEGETYANALKKAGVRTEHCRVPDALHGYFGYSEEVPQVRMTYGRINRFLRSL